MLFAKRFNAVSFLVCFLVGFSISIFAGYYPVLPQNPPVLVEEKLPPPPSKPIATVISSADFYFQTLNKALHTAGLMERLSYNSKDEDSYTIFAPTNYAFESSNQGIDWWLNSENKNVKKKILEYHIVKGSLTSPNLNGSLKTLEGSSVKIKLHSSQIIVGGAEVGKRDINASNGVIHEINKVICPPDMKC